MPFNSETLVTGKLFEDIREAVHLTAKPEDYDAVVVINLCVPTASGVPLDLLVNSAWRFVSAPADADSVISVGAVDSMRVKVGFSSFGPSADGRIKPTLSAQGYYCAILAPSGAAVHGNGTSVACPELAGMVAGLWQANPRLTAPPVASRYQRPRRAQSSSVAALWFIV